MQTVASLLFALSPAACARDEAAEEYHRALRGDEEGLSREEQIAHLDRAIALAPDRLSYRVSRAIAWIDVRRFDLAVRDLDYTLQRREHPYEHFLRGLALCQQGSFARALPDFDRAIELQPENSQFYRGRALALLELGRSRKALEDAEVLVHRAPEFGTSYYVRGRALHAVGRLQDALQDLDRAVTMRPELVYPLIARAETREAMGDREGAAADRELARRQAERERRVWAHTDPFRY
jgi:tetratricopeptide (TPR) repeat protein